MRGHHGLSNGNGVMGLTAVAGTPIRVLIPPSDGCRPYIKNLLYKPGGTAHNLTILRPIGRTFVDRAVGPAAASQAVLYLQRDPGLPDLSLSPYTNNALAANDLLAIRETDGKTRLYTVQSVAPYTAQSAGGLKVTLTGNLTSGVDPSSGAMAGRTWNFGAVGDVCPDDGQIHPNILTDPNNQLTLAGLSSEHSAMNFGCLGALAGGDPILFSADNLTNSGTLLWLNWSYDIPGDISTAR